MNGGLRDPLDGGFFRYAIDAEWRYPYFQKTLADQARLALAFLDAAKVSGDADSAKQRGARFSMCSHDCAWPMEISPPAKTPRLRLWRHPISGKNLKSERCLGDKAAQEFSSLYGVTTEGNIPPDTFGGIDTAGQNFLRPNVAHLHLKRKVYSVNRARNFSRNVNNVRAPLQEDNATSGMHGLFLQALSRAGVQLNDAQLLAAAESELKYIRERLILPDGTLRRIAGRTAPAAPEDYAFVISGLQAYQAVPKGRRAADLSKSLLNAVDQNVLERSGRPFDDISRKE